MSSFKKTNLKKQNVKKLQNIIIAIFSGIIAITALIGVFCYKGVILEAVKAFQALFKGKIMNGFNHLVNACVFVLIVLLFSNSIYICKTAFVGEHTPYRYSDSDYYHIQTKNKEFEYHLWLRKDKEQKKQDLLTMEEKFAQFKQKNPQYKELKLYHTHNYINVKFWTFWKWICYTPSITNKYDYLEIDE